MNPPKKTESKKENKAQHNIAVGALPTPKPMNMPGHDMEKVPSEYMSKRMRIKDSENILAYVEGSEKSNEIIVISAHYDHVGEHNGQIYNGADDDGSGTVGVMAIAEAFHKAKKAGFGPKRSILFLHVTGEEKGLLVNYKDSHMEIVLVSNKVSGIEDNFSDTKFYFENIRKELYHKLSDYYGKVSLCMMPNFKFSVNIEKCDNLEEVKKIIHEMPKNLQDWIFKK
ncbi:hypothetical protein FQR65_LT17922 [Abscondita terminalis]|nr:hypothetical protein FQR65_LT17922 [Abscondita terminalis]